MVKLSRRSSSTKKKGEEMAENTWHETAFTKLSNEFVRGQTGFSGTSGVLVARYFPTPSSSPGTRSQGQGSTRFSYHVTDPQYGRTGRYPSENPTSSVKTGEKREQNQNSPNPEDKPLLTLFSDVPRIPADSGFCDIETWLKHFLGVLFLSVQAPWGF